MITVCSPLKNLVPTVKEWYWVPHPSKVWVTVLVKRVSGDVCWVTTSDSMTEFELSLTDCPFLCLNPRVVGDMASLMHLHEAGILHNLSERANPQHQHPYTYVSTVLIALNPLRPVPMPAMEDYKDIPLGAAPPNPYGIAEMAYKSLTMVRNKKIRNQSIVISGESGAGKTETAKIVLRYLCWRSTTGQGEAHAAGRSARRERKESSVGGGGGGVSLDKKLLDTNPILEAFGNAKTFRNANSSRFGKLLKLNFNSNLNFGLVSASIDTYLLEKSRVALFPAGERNYHVFYQLLRGAGSLERKRWQLREVSQYQYLNHGQAGDIDDVDDKADFGKLTSGLLTVGIDMVQQDLVFRVLSAVLALGNVTFEPVEGPSGETAETADPRALARVAELLGVREQLLEAVLTSRSLDMSASSSGGRTSSYRIPLDVQQAAYARDAVAKSIYDTVFHWIIRQIRLSLLQQHVRQAQEPPCVTNYIGVLDIFGFESFEKNGLEQLLINFANESLQLIFNRAVLDAEQEMYREEGFLMQHIEYVDNNACVNLIAMGRDAILTSLDAVCRAPEPTEEKFNSLLHKTHAKNSHFLKPEMKNMRTTFKIKHYAKAVHYTVGTFIQKNMDSCPAELGALLSSSSHAARCSLFSFDLDAEEAEGGDGNWVGEQGGQQQQQQQQHEESRRRTPAAPKTRTLSNTVGKKFKLQMTALSDLLSATNCTFIRCIKPNASMTPGLFEHRFVMDQVRSLGVVQTCEVLRQGLPARVQFAEIESIYRGHFRGVNLSLTKRLSGRVFTEAVLWAMHIPKTAYKLGISRVFFNVDSLNDMNKVLNSYTDVAELEAIVKRVIRCVHLKRWRRVFVAGSTYAASLRLLELCRHRSRCAIFIQRRWRAYALSTLRAKRLLARRRWKVAIYYTICSQHFLENYRLICEAREMRLRAERAAEKELQESRAAEVEQQRRIDEMASRSGVDTQAATKSCAKRFRSTLNIGRGSSSMLQQNQQDISESKALCGENQDLEAALMQQQVSQSRAEMKKLVAASSLATVSVALYRWTKIKKFRAFEKWMSFFRSGERMPKAAEVAQTELIGLTSTRLDQEEDGIESLIRADGSFLCFECKDRGAKVWCHDCNQPYCLVCSQFVHNSCIVMRYHRPLGIECKPSMANIKVLSTPMEPLSSFVAAGTMKAMVNALLFSESNIRNDNSSVSKMLYYSNASAMFDLEGLGNQASVLLDRVYEDRAVEVLEEEEETAAAAAAAAAARTSSQQITFSGSGGLVQHGSGSGSGEDVQQCALRSCNAPACKGISIRFCAAHYDEFRSATRSISNGGEEDSGDDATTTLQQQVALLKKQLIDSGQQPVEFVELSVARALMQAAVERLMSGDEGAEADIERWDKAIRLNPEYQVEMLEKARKWEEDERPANLQCLRLMRGLVPLDVRQISAATMEAQGLPKKVAQRVWSKKILWFVCTHPEDIAKIHVADLRTKYSYVGMDIVEMRAVYASLPIAFENDGDGKKKEWRDAFRQKLEEFSMKEANCRLTNPEMRNFAYKGSDSLSIYDPDVPIPRAELLKSDAFGPTDMASLAELTGVGGVKDKQNRMNKGDHTTSTSDGAMQSNVGGHVGEGRGSHGNDDGKTDRGGAPTSRLIAESALAADEQKRAEARGSLISITSNPLVNLKELAALRRPAFEEGQDVAPEQRRAKGEEQEAASDSALDGGILSIQQTILKLEMAKNLKSKNDRNKADDDKEEDSKKLFSDQFIAKGVRTGSKPLIGGRGRGGRGRPPSGQSRDRDSALDEVLRESGFSDRWSSESAAGLGGEDMRQELLDQQQQQQARAMALLALSRDSEVRESGATDTDTDADVTVDSTLGVRANASSAVELAIASTDSERQSKLQLPLPVPPPSEEVIDIRPAAETTNESEAKNVPESIKNTESVIDQVVREKPDSPIILAEVEDSVTASPPPPPPPPRPPRHSDDLSPLDESSVQPIESTADSTAQVGGGAVIPLQEEEEDGFSKNIVIKKKTEAPPVKKKGLWGMIKKK